MVSLCMLCGGTEVCLFRNRNHIKISHDFEQFVDREMHPLFFFVLDLGFKVSIHYFINDGFSGNGGITSSIPFISGK